MRTQEFAKDKKTNLRAVLTWAIAFLGLTVICALSLIAGNINPSTDFSPSIIAIGYLPSLAALCLTPVFFGKSGLGKILKQIFRWRVGISWYILALFGPSLLILVANIIYLIAGGPVQWSSFFDFASLSAAIGPLIAGSLGEEIGWRGFAQPLLQKSYGALWAAIIIGILWGTWHLWPILAPGGLEALISADVIQTYVRFISTAIIYAWIYNSTKGSLLLVMLAHAGHNIAIDLMPAGSDIALIIAFLYLIAAGVVVRMAGARTLTGKLASH